jgi:hypothetical protein
MVLRRPVETTTQSGHELDTNVSPCSLVWPYDSANTRELGWFGYQPTDHAAACTTDGIGSAGLAADRRWRRATRLARRRRMAGDHAGAGPRQASLRKASAVDRTTFRQRLISQPLDFDPRSAVMVLVKQAINPGQRDAGLVDV